MAEELFFKKFKVRGRYRKLIVAVYPALLMNESKLEDERQDGQSKGRTFLALMIARTGSIAPSRELQTFIIFLTSQEKHGFIFIHENRLANKEWSIVYRVCIAILYPRQEICSSDASDQGFPRRWIIVRVIDPQRSAETPPGGGSGTLIMPRLLVKTECS